MKLLFLASADSVHTRRWVGWFQRRGHRVLLATLEPSGTEGLPETVLPRRAGLPALRYFLAAPAVGRLVEQYRPELVNAHFVPGYGFLASLVKAARPLVISAWGSDVLLNPERSFFHGRRARYALARAGLVTSDAGNLTSALAGLGVNRDRILQVPMGVETEIFHPRTSRESAGRLRLVSTRRLEPLYNPAVLIEAASLLFSKGLDFELTIAGDGSLRGELGERVREAGLAGRVTFTGALPRQELAELLRGCDIYLSASLSDSTSVSLLEAMASGAFPVVSDIAGNREWIGHGINGLLFDPADASALAGRIISCAGDRELREEAAGRNAETIRRKACWEDNMIVVEGKFRELVESSG